MLGQRQETGNSVKRVPRAAQLLVEMAPGAVKRHQANDKSARRGEGALRFAEERHRVFSKAERGDEGYKPKAAAGERQVLTATLDDCYPTAGGQPQRPRPQVEADLATKRSGKTASTGPYL